MAGNASVSGPVIIESARVAMWEEAVGRARAWLAGQVNGCPPFGGAVADVNWYAKSVWPLVASGDRVSALRVLHGVDRLADAGTLEAPAQTGWTNTVSYALGWLVVGARQAEAYDMARRLYRRLGAYVCPQAGGLRSEPDTGYFDVAIQGALLHAAVAMGDLEAAGRCGDLVGRLIHEQPDSRQYFYNYFNPERGFLTTGAMPPSQRCFRVGDSGQPWANLGFALQGLARLHDCTADARYLEACRTGVDWCLERCGDDVLGRSQNHKVAHAALMLHGKTGQGRYLRAALTIADRMAGNIQSDGRALADVWFDDIDRQPLYATVRTTCDSLLWLRQIADALRAAPDASWPAGRIAP